MRCKSKGYTRSFGSMCRQIRKKGYKKDKKKRKSFTKYSGISGSYLGEKVQIDIKYVPIESIKFPTYGKRYYQITAIDEFSRKRILEICDEKSSYETGKFLEKLEEKMGFPIKIIQVDNGYEFVNDREKTNKKGYFEMIAEKKGYEIKRTRPYSPWQNGKVERSHREDGKILYSQKKFKSENKRTRPYSPWQNGKVERSHREDGKILYSQKKFKSEKELREEVKKHEKRYNKTAKISLKFKSPNEIVKENIGNIFIS